MLKGSVWFLHCLTKTFLGNRASKVSSFSDQQSRYSYAVTTKHIHLQENTTRSTHQKILAKLIDQNATVCKQCKYYKVYLHTRTVRGWVMGMQEAQSWATHSSKVWAPCTRKRGKENERLLQKTVQYRPGLEFPLTLHPQGSCWTSSAGHHSIQTEKQ